MKALAEQITRPPSRWQCDWGWLAVLAGLSFALYPLLQPGLPSVADAAIHLFRTAEWVRVWQDGIVYPRWSPNLAFGYGFPLFIFAPPLPYVIAGLLHIAGLSLDAAIKALPFLSLLAMGLGMYELVRDTFGWESGFLAAAAFAYAPFQLRESYLYGGNYPQLLAIATFPWMVWAFRRVVLRGRLGDVLLAGVVYALLALSHNFHAFIFTPVVAVYVIGLCAVHRSWRATWRAALAGLLGLALSAAFWLPALYERQWSLAHEGFYIARSNFQLRFLSWRELLAWPTALDAGAANPYLPFALGWGAVALGGLGFLTLLLARRLTREQRYHLTFFSTSLCCAVFMILPVSAPLWERVPLLATAEFPWRLMGLVALSLAFLGGASLHLTTYLPRISEESRGVLAVLVAFSAVVLSTMVYTYPPKPFIAYGTPTLAEGVQYELATQTIGTTTLGEYLPRWVQERPLTSPMLEDYLAGRLPDKLDRSALPESKMAELLEHTSARDVYRVSSREPWQMRLFTFYYPGWTAVIDGEPTEVTVDEPRGLILVDVPAGEHRIVISFVDIPLRTAANALSLAAWVMAVAGFAYTALRGSDSLSGGRATSQEAIAVGSGASLKQASLIAVMILLVIGLRAALVDPFTTWFRRHSPPGEVIGVQHPARLNFDGRVELLGYDLWGEPAKPGDDIHVRLYWRAFRPVGEDFSTFVHLDALPSLTTRAQSDNVHPGDARAQIDVPVRTWTPETYVRDEHTVVLPGEIAPIGYALRVGLYDRRGQRLRVLDENGQAVDDAGFLQVLHVLPRTPPSLDGADRMVYRLGEEIELVGSRLDAAEGTADRLLRVHLFWRTRKPLTQNYTVFVHVLDQENAVIAQADGPPLNGAYPTSWWYAGQIIEDVHDVRLDNLASTDLRIAVGMYLLESGERLEVKDERGATMVERQIILRTGPQRSD